MIRRALGNTGLSLPILGFGASPLGGVFGPTSEDEAHLAVARALEVGINYFDVSPFYGDTLAEQVLGRALRPHARDHFLLSTKVGRYGTEFDFSTRRIRVEFERSLRRLNVDHVDMVLCHDIEFVPLAQIIEEALPTLRALVEEGKARFVGVSGLPLRIFREVLAHTDLDFVLSYCRYSLQNNELRTLFTLLEERGVGVISAAPLAMGLLGGYTLPDWHPATPLMRDCADKAAEICARNNTTLARLALQFALREPRITSTLVGMSNPQTLQENLSALQATPNEELLCAVEEALAPVHNLIWPSGLPENHDLNMEGAL